MATDWAAWSREAVLIMQRRNDAWQRRFQLPTGTPFRWDLTVGTLTFQRGLRSVMADAVLVGTASDRDGFFVWSWADEEIPRSHRSRTVAVRDFGTANGLTMLVAAKWSGGRTEAQEAVAVAGRILEAEGVFVDEHDGLTACFALFDFRESH